MYSNTSMYYVGVLRVCAQIFDTLGLAVWLMALLACVIVLFSKFTSETTRTKLLVFVYSSK